MLPSWTPNNELLYIGDQTDWWNLYHVNSNGDHINLLPRDKETGGPHWVFAYYAYAVDPTGNGRVVLNSGSVSTINKEMGDIIEYTILKEIVEKC